MTKVSDQDKNNLSIVPGDSQAGQGFCVDGMTIDLEAAVGGRRRIYVKHSIYSQASRRNKKYKGNTPEGRQRKRLREEFLSDFTNPSARIQALADSASFNWVVLEGFRAAYLRGEVLPVSILKDYTALSNALARDLNSLETLARLEKKKEKKLNIEEYIKALKCGKLKVLKKEPECLPPPAPQLEQPKAEAEKSKTLF
jgi:hypothetical protein